MHSNEGASRSSHSQTTQAFIFRLDDTGAGLECAMPWPGSARGPGDVQPSCRRDQSPSRAETAEINGVASNHVTGAAFTIIVPTARIVPAQRGAPGRPTRERPGWHAPRRRPFEAVRNQTFRHSRGPCSCRDHRWARKSVGYSTRQRASTRFQEAWVRGALPPRDGSPGRPLAAGHRDRSCRQLRVQPVEHLDPGGRYGSLGVRYRKSQHYLGGGTHRRLGFRRPGTR